MKSLINKIIAFLNTAISAGIIISTAKVHKGLYGDPSLIAFSDFPYICVDDGGERTELSGTSAQKRTYIVNIEMGCYGNEIETVLDAILDFTDQVKTVFETETNRQKDGLVWGVHIIPFAWEKEGLFYRGRQVAIEFTELELTYQDY